MEQNRAAAGFESMLTATAHVERDGAAITVVGDLDAVSAPRLRSVGRDAVDEGHVDITVDMAGVPFIDAAGLGVLIGILRHVTARGGSVRLVRPRRAVSRALSLTGLDEVFTVESVEPQALSA